MKNFLSSTKGKIIAGAVTLAVIAGVVVLIILLNTGYRNICVENLSGTTKVTSLMSISDAFKGQNLISGDKVEVFEKSSLTLALDSDKHVVANELTKFSLEAFGIAGKDSRTVIHLEKGSISNQIDNKLLPSESYVVESPNASMSVRGTVFSVNVFFDNEGLCHTVVEVEQGVVEFAEKGTDKVKTLNAGESASVISRVAEKNDDNSGVNSGNSSSGGNSGGSGQTLTFGDFKYRYNETLGGIEIKKYKGNDENVSIPSEINGEKVVKIGNSAFWKCEVTSVTIPDGITEIDKGAFLDCVRLTSIVIPDSVTRIGEFAFSACRGLKSIVIPNSITKIEKGVFNCCGLESITIPDSVTVIERAAFESCIGLHSIVIPDSVTRIERGAFVRCQARITYKGRTYTKENYIDLYTE